MLRQALNIVKIEGILSETNLKYGSFEKNGRTVENIGGTINVLVEQVINGKDATVEIPVYMFATKYKNDGGDNPAYASIERVMKEFISIAAAGNKAAADRVRITKGNLIMNEYPDQSGKIVSTPRVRASFVTKVTGDIAPEASFDIEFMIQNISRMVDENGVELDPTKVEVVGIVPQYSHPGAAVGNVDVMKFCTEDPTIVNGIESRWEIGNCYKAHGRINFSYATKTVVQEDDSELAFGPAIENVRTFTSNVHELVITSGSAALNESVAFPMNEIQNALTARKVRLEESKNKNTAKRAPAQAQNASRPTLDLGF